MHPDAKPSPPPMRSMTSSEQVGLVYRFPSSHKHRRPVVPVGGMHLAERGRHHLDVGELLHGGLDHPEEDARVELRLRLLRDLRPLDAEPLLHVLLVADETIDVGDDLAHHLDCALLAAHRLPELGTVVEIERHDSAGLPARLHALDDELARRLGECREDAAGVEPAHAPREDRLPVEVAGLEEPAGLVGAVVEDDRRTDAVTAIAVDGGDVGPANAVVLELLVEGSDAHLADPGLYKFAERVVHHRRADAGLEAKAVGEVGGHVVLAAGDVDVQRAGLAERHHAGVEAMDQSAQGDQVEGAGVGADWEGHRSAPDIGCGAR